MKSGEKQISMVATLGEPARRRLNDDVVRQCEPVSRDDPEALGPGDRLTASRRG